MFLLHVHENLVQGKSIAYIHVHVYSMDIIEAGLDDIKVWAFSGVQ